MTTADAQHTTAAERHRSPWRRRILAGTLLLLVLAGLVALREPLERPFQRFAGAVVEVVKDHPRAVLGTALATVSVLWLAIGARCYFEGEGSA